MKKKPIFFLLLLSGIEGFVAAIQSGMTPSESERSLLGGLSFERLVLIFGLSLLSFLFLGLAYWVGRNNRFSERCKSLFSNPWINLLFGLVALIAWILVFTPASGWGRFGGYKERVTPSLIWLLLLSIQALALPVFERIKKNGSISLRDILLSEKELLRKWILVLGTLAALVFFVAVSRIGLIPDIVYWNDFNLPLLGIQVISVLTSSVLILIFLSKMGFFQNNHKLIIQNAFPDIVLCLLLWGAAVLIWTGVDMPKSFFAPGPYPPNNEMYPFSDAVLYDREAMKAVIGEGIGKDIYLDKPFYIAFLSVIHMIAGNRMSAVVGIQVAVVALFPAILYLLGTRIHSRLAGLLVAFLFILREVNNIQGTLWVLSTNSRVLMSESLAGLLLVLFVFFLTRWMQNKKTIVYLMAAGGFLGLASMARLNPILVMPMAVVGIFVFCWKRWKKAVIYSLILFSMFLASMLPWMIQSHIRSNKFFFFIPTIDGVILKQRAFYALNKPLVPEAENNPSEPGQVPYTATPSPSVNNDEPSNRTWIRISGIARYVSGHFFHNLIDSAAIFPTTLTLNSLEDTIKDPESFWSPDWDGQLSTERSLILGATLLTLSLGMAAGWSRSGISGLVPAGFLISYSLATAAVRTSGGRYIIPADWVAILYFAIGIAHIAYWGSKRYGGVLPSPVIEFQPQNNTGQKNLRWIIGVIINFVLIGSVPVILNNLIPQKYKAVEKNEIASLLSERALVDDLGISSERLDDFLLLPDSVAYYGMGLYPRYYPQDKGEPDQFSAYRVQKFPRLVMSMIGPSFSVTGVLPVQKSPESLPNGSDVLAIGCKGKYNDDWLAIIVDDVVYLRSPASEWTCPVQLPVCDDNRVCQ